MRDCRGRAARPSDTRNRVLSGHVVRTSRDCDRTGLQTTTLTSSEEAECDPTSSFHFLFVGRCLARLYHRQHPRAPIRHTRQFTVHPAQVGTPFAQVFAKSRQSSAHVDANSPSRRSSQRVPPSVMQRISPSRPSGSALKIEHAAGPPSGVTFPVVQTSVGTSRSKTTASHSRSSLKRTLPPQAPSASEPTTQRREYERVVDRIGEVTMWAQPTASRSAHGSRSDHASRRSSSGKPSPDGRLSVLFFLPGS
jgi:hypothetical protein